MTADANNPELNPTSGIPAQEFRGPDNGLSPRDAESFHEWLHKHPESVAEFHALTHFVEFWRKKALPEPTATAWDCALGKIEMRLAQPQPRPLPPARSLLFRTGLGLAAASLTAALVWRLLLPVSGPPATVTAVAEEEPYPVATSDEITIVTMDPRESRSLVVGLPPIPGDLEWASFEDVTLEATKPNADNQVPEMHKGGTKPMILPTGSWGGKEED